MKVEIDVDLGPWSAEWELVAIRRGRSGEYIVHNERVLQLTGVGYDCQMVVRQKWQWPEWLTAEWIAMDANGQWYAHEKEPWQTFSSWESGGTLKLLSTPLLAFTPPPCDDWRQSKRRNPRVGKAA